MTDDLSVRIELFNWLTRQVDIHGDVLPRELLLRGFVFRGERVPLVSPQGIHKPRILDLPLTITTSPDGPYDDSFDNNGLLVYKYRGIDPAHRDNVGLRQLMRLQRPLAYFHGLVPGRYLVVWPVYVVGDDPSSLSFTMAVDEMASIQRLEEATAILADSSEAKRVYLTTTVRQRLHQRSFREKVLEAYRTQCSICRLRHRELLDAAHIIPDQLPASRPTVDNGLALCKLHHAAFDSFMIGVSPDYRVEVRQDILAEEDGPILRYGLQQIHRVRIELPRLKSDWPSQESLAWRYEQFQLAR